MASLRGLVSQLGGRRTAARRPAGGRTRGVAGGSRGRATGGSRRDEAISRGVRKLVARGRR